MADNEKGDVRPGLADSVRRRELSMVLANALAELSDEQREVIVLRSLEERDWPEVAVVTFQQHNFVEEEFGQSRERE